METVITEVAGRTVDEVQSALRNYRQCTPISAHRGLLAETARSNTYLMAQQAKGNQPIPGFRRPRDVADLVV
jgi:cellobiose phosphorylase